MVSEAERLMQKPAMNESEKKKRIAFALLRFHLTRENLDQRERNEGILAFWCSVILTMVACLHRFEWAAPFAERLINFVVAVACVLSWLALHKIVRGATIMQTTIKGAVLEGAVMATAAGYFFWFMYKAMLAWR